MVLPFSFWGYEILMSRYSMQIEKGDKNDKYFVVVGAKKFFIAEDIVIKYKVQ